jgi:predicted Ser/Thr protein kinase
VSLAELDKLLARRDQRIPSAERAKFRKDLLMAILAHHAKPANAGKRLWSALDPDIREKLEPSFEPTATDVLEVIRYAERKTAKEKEEHEAFLQRFYAMGITKNQARRMIEWHLDPKSYR